jgi:hypothetical protein
MGALIRSVCAPARMRRRFETLSRDPFYIMAAMQLTILRELLGDDFPKDDPRHHRLVIVGDRWDLRPPVR